MSVYRLKGDGDVNPQFQLRGFPVPESVNNSLTVSRGRLIKSKKQRLFFSQATWYAYTHRDAITKMRAELHQILNRGFMLAVDCYFAFPMDRLLYKRKKTPTRLDANNRLKPTLDALVDMIGIDDSFFFAGNCEKVEAPDQESVTLVIRAVRMRHLTAAEQTYGREIVKL